MAKGSRKRKATATGTEALLEAVAVEELNDAVAPSQLEDSDLFVFDTEPDAAAIHLPSSGRKRPRASKEKKLTRAQAILAASGKGVPLGSGGAYAPRKRDAAHREQLPSEMALSAKKKRVAPPAERMAAKTDAWDEAAAAETWVPPKATLTRPKMTGVPNRPKIAAVEVDPAGCSYNPDYEQHQDAVAEAVAAEVAKQIERQFEPEAIPLTVTQAQFDMSEMAVGLGDDDEDDESADDGDDAANAPVQTKKTKKDRTKGERRKAQETALAEKKSLKAMRRDIDSAKKLSDELQTREQQLASKLARKQADQDDKEKTLPPKLGRHKWKAAPLQVLASDNITGSLRKLRAFPMVAKDRFNSLQKRGVVQVTVQQHWTKPSKRRVKEFEKGLVREQAIKGQETLDALARSNRERERKKRIKK